ncbi:MAG: AAA family ATPase [Gammaproteobacteria bacterium]|nr:AAA family ATPase [Gammaproteobacteria bacterium]MDE0413502.1 AAA family ATPase [Gammaproteobacteria bacterium]
MIHRLLLKNWRSYEDLNLELGPGTTFVVAPNGVGKTSLVYALAWGVFGEHSNVDQKSCIRAGAASAKVLVEFDLPNGRRLSISRTVKRRGAPIASYEMNGAKLTESSALAEMEQAFGVELPVAGRLSMMLGGGHIAASDSLNLESHLHHAFGVSHLFSAAKNAQSVAKAAKKARASLRLAAKQRIQNRAAIENEITALEAEITNLRQIGTQLKQSRDAAATQVSLVERQLAHADQVKNYEQQRARRIGKIERLIGRSISNESNELLNSELRIEIEASEHEIAELIEGVVTARSVITAAEQAISLLEGEHATCPTCMRGLPHHERVSALSAHKSQRLNALMELEHLEEACSEKQSYMRNVSRLLTSFEALQPPRIANGQDKVPSRKSAQTAYQRANAALDKHNQRLGRARSRLELLKEQIASDNQIRLEEKNLRQAYRREAAALAGEMVLREAANHVVESRIAPLAIEVQGRWKHLFTSNGLALKPDGSITRIWSDEELDWDMLSGGERTWARLVTHLIVIAATTSLPFAWFDEPLEHLDPQLRHAVAATLATATLGGSPSQLLVTTYEHGIAQQLADDTDGAQIIAIRESGASSSPHELGP